VELTFSEGNHLKRFARLDVFSLEGEVGILCTRFGRVRPNGAGGLWRNHPSVEKHREGANDNSSTFHRVRVEHAGYWAVNTQSEFKGLPYE
jgi:hypothetical protein